MRTMDDAIRNALTAMYSLITSSDNALVVHNGICFPANNDYIRGFGDINVDIKQGDYHVRDAQGVYLLPTVVVDVDIPQRVALLPVDKIPSQLAKQSGCAYVLLYIVHVDFEQWVRNRSMDISYEIAMNKSIHDDFCIEQTYTCTYDELQAQIRNAQRASVRAAYLNITK